MALGSSIIQMIFSILLLTKFRQTSPIKNWDNNFRFVERYDWIDISLSNIGQLKIDYFVGVDGISLPLVVLSSFVLFIGVLSSWNVQDRPKGYFILYLVLSSSIIGCFIALDFFLFYLCFEFMLLPMFFLIGVWGGKQRSYAAIKFFLYTLVGSLFVLVVMIGLYLSMDESHYAFSLVNMLKKDYEIGSILDINNKTLYLGYTARFWAFLFLLIGFGIKLPLVPVHTWLPDAHVEAPTPISVILAGLLLKIGAYGMFRMVFGIFSDIAIHYAWLVAVLGVISIIYGALNALAQQDLKRMVAYSSVSHMGFVLVGLASATNEGVSGAFFYMISHGIISSALFILVGVLYDRTANRTIANFSGLASKMPQYIFFMAIFYFAALGMPGLSGFIGELMVLLGAFKSNLFSWWIGLLSLLGIILSASYFLWTIQRIAFGKYFVRKRNWEEKMEDLTFRELLILIILAIPVFLLGIYPKLLFNYSNESITFFVYHLLNF